ncbi:MAG: PD-(D/E)XK nuclease family protein [Verrucomicrobiota bacterium]
MEFGQAILDRQEPGFSLDNDFTGRKIKFVKRRELTTVQAVPPIFSQGFKQLIESQDWRRLAKMPGVVDTFNVFHVLDDAVCENSWSSIVAALFSSNASHDLDMRALRIWLSEVGDSRFVALAKRAKSSSVSREWGTMERRRLDILVKLLDERGHLIGIIGIENKVWSGEQHNQLKDYQAALCNGFPHVPKILLFLTPDGRESDTSDVSKSCPCRRCSYKTIVSMCNKLQLSASKELRLLLSSLHDFIDLNILTTSVMKAKVKQVVRGLYQNENHRMILDAIFDNRPTLEDAFAHINKQVVEFFAQKKPKIICSLEQWPEKVASPQELQVFPEPLRKSGFSIGYLLRSKTHRPFIGDSFTILIAAWCESAAARRRIQNLNAHLPKRAAHDFKNWSSWELIWEGDTYELKNLGGNDSRNLSRMLVKTMRKTYEPLKLAISKV